MTNEKLIAREIRKYNIMANTYVRGTGSAFGGHERRCIWEICGKPMLQWALEAPLKSKYVNKVVLVSEDQEILRLGEKIDGVTIIPRPLDTSFKVPRNWGTGIFQRQRPRSLFSGEPFIKVSKDSGLVSGQPSRDILEYCFWYLQEHESYVTDIEVVVPANEPMSTTKALDELIEAFFLDEEANRAYTFYPVMPYLFTINPKDGRPFPLFHWEGLDRQMYPPIYRQGPFQIFGNPLKTTYSSTSKIAFIIIPPEEAMDIHDKEDLLLANFYMQRRLAKQKEKGGEMSNG